MLKKSVTGTHEEPVQSWQRILANIFASGLGTGYASAAQGTLGSLLLVVLWYFFMPARKSVEWVAALAMNLVSVPLSHWGEKMWGPDPGRVTVDEFAGQAIVLAGIPRKPLYFLVAFLLFRLFDVFKLPVIRKQIETLPGGWGVTLDDTAAGVLGRVVFQLIRSLENRHR